MHAAFSTFMNLKERVSVFEIKDKFSCFSFLRKDSTTVFHYHDTKMIVHFHKELDLQVLVAVTQQIADPFHVDLKKRYTDSELQ